MLQVVQASGGLQGYGGGKVSSGVTQMLQPTTHAAATFNPQPAYAGSSQLLQPTVSPVGAHFATTAPTGGGGTGGGTTTPQNFTDFKGNSFSSQAAADASNARMEADFNNLKNSTFNSIGDAVTQGGQGFNSSILDYLDSRKLQQNQVDSDSVQNELAREQGAQSVLDMVGNGIRSSGVTLANHNAGSSSATEAIARAFGITGRQDMSKVGNQFAQGQSKVNTEENNILLGDATEQRHAGEDKTNTINSIVNSARQQLASLNQSAAYASIPDRVDIEGKIAEVKQQALDALSAYDGVLTNGIANNPRMADGDVRAKANGLLTAGVAPTTSFDFSTNIPTQFQGTGQFPSELPIFLPKKNNTQ